MNEDTLPGLVSKQWTALPASELDDLHTRLAALEAWARDVLANAEAEYHQPNKPTRSVPVAILDRCPVQPDKEQP